MKRFKDRYHSDIVVSFKKDYDNLNMIPKVQKIVLNMGVGEVVSSSKVIDSAVADLTMISGQKPLITKARKSVANFKLREGMKVGCKVTLRKSRMYDFLERLVMIALPRVKQFRGFALSNFDGRGNFNFGIKEQIVFPEIDYDKIDAIRGLNVTIVTTARTDAEAKVLLEKFDIPFCN